MHPQTMVYVYRAYSPSATPFGAMFPTDTRLEEVHTKALGFFNLLTPATPATDAPLYVLYRGDQPLTDPTMTIAEVGTDHQATTIGVVMFYLVPQTRAAVVVATPSTQS